MDERSVNPIMRDDIFSCLPDSCFPEVHSKYYKATRVVAMGSPLATDHMAITCRTIHVKF